MVAELSVPGAALSRLVRRGLESVPNNLQQLRFDAGAYERAGPDMEVKPEQLLPVLITGIVMFLLIASVRYSIGDVVASLAMIESPSSTAIITPKLPAYSEEDDTVSEKEPLMDKTDLEADVDVTVINHKPITAKITTTIACLQREGGFLGKWRGAGWSIFYHTAHSLLTHAFASAFGFTWISNALFFLSSSILLSRLHMKWTHAMISRPATTPQYEQLVPSKWNAVVLILPTIAFATAQQATLLVPMGVASILGLLDGAPENAAALKHGNMCWTMLALYGFGVFAVVFTGLLVAFTALLPASIVLTRIEASLLPEGRQALVPFDRDAIVGELDLTTRAGRKGLFVQTWRSVNCAAKMRLIKLYVKLVLVQFTIAVVGLHLMVAEVFLVGGEKVGIFLRSGYAQIQLAMMDVPVEAGN